MLNSQVHQLFVWFSPFFFVSKKGILEIRLIAGTQHPTHRESEDYFSSRAKFSGENCKLSQHSPRGEPSLKGRERKWENLQIKKVTYRKALYTYLSKLTNALK